MNRLSDTSGAQLSWQLAGDVYELRDGANVLATLTWKQGVSLYLGETAGGRWTFKRTGIFHTTLTVRREGSAETAALEAAGGGGKLPLSDGSQAKWSIKSGEWQLKDAQGSVLLGMKSTGKIDKLSGDVTLTPAAMQLPEVELLALFGWYVLVLQAKDQAEAEQTAILAALLASI